MRGVEQIPWLYDCFLWFGERCGGLSRWRYKLVGGVRGRVLEVGAGTGRNLPLYDARSRVVAVEPDRAMIRTAHKRAPHARFAVARVEHLPFRHESFGTVVSSLVFCSVRDPQRGLAEIRRVLAPGGELRMMEHVRSLRRWVAKIQDLVQPAWTAVTGGCHPNRDTEEAVRRAGFTIDPATRQARGHLRLLSAR